MICSDVILSKGGINMARKKEVAKPQVIKVTEKDDVVKIVVKIS